jgi:hypothetical protein
MKLFVGALARTRTDSYGRVVSSAVNGEDLPYASPGGNAGFEIAPVTIVVRKKYVMKKP